ncbi:hypothetical protein Tco_0064213 [Tanacetum coccineum]|uniref:Uncharacterized protein n=1 Tax=Tanacetum coccineum TaxID=301880 RepID=A0ABQ4Z2N5_9ASTR
MLFSLEFKSAYENYTRYDVQAFYDAMSLTWIPWEIHAGSLFLHQQRTPHVLKQYKLMQNKDDHQSNSRLNVDSVKVRFSCPYINIVLRKKKVIQGMHQQYEFKGMQLEF